MFFVFLILLLTIYVSETNNFILKNDSLGGSYNVYHNSKYLISQDDRDVVSSLPTPKKVIPITHIFKNRIKSNLAMNNFVKKKPEEVLVKRHIQGKQLPYTSPFFKTTKGALTSTLELKRKLPVVEFGSDPDNINEYLHYFDEIEKKLPFYHDFENVPKSKLIPQNLENRFLYQQNNYSKHSKDKVFDLRSLPSQNCQNCERCGCSNVKKPGKIPPIDNVQDCTRKSELITTMNYYPPYNVFPTNNPLGPQSPPDRQDSQGNNKDISMNFPMGIGVPVGIPFGMPAGYAGGIPVGLPANVPIAFAPSVAPPYYQENNFKEVTTHRKPCRHQNDHLYYNDDDESGKIYVDNDDDYNKKKRKHKGEVFVNIEYDVDETKKPNRNNPNALATDIFKDLQKSYADTLVKKCYCNSSSSFNINNVNFVVVFPLSILLFVKFTTAI